MTLDDGTIWKNLTTEAKSKPAETLAEFRGAHAYNLLDENVRRFNAEVAIAHPVGRPRGPEQLVLAEDHRRADPGNIKAGVVYKERRVSILAPHAMRAFLDYYPIRRNPFEQDRIYQNFPLRPLARGLPRRRALLSRRQQLQPPGAARAGHGLPRATRSSAG